MKQKRKFLQRHLLQLSPVALLIPILTLLVVKETSGLDNVLRRRSFHVRQERTEGNALRSGSRKSPSGGGSSFPNQLQRVDASSRLSSRWEASGSVCEGLPGLTREQTELCLRSPDASEVAVAGIQMGLSECGHQMARHRWNCSSLQGNPDPHSTHLLQKGYRESAFGHAIASAGVTFAVAKACSQGNLLSCGCGFQYDDTLSHYATHTQDLHTPRNRKELVGGGGSGGGGEGEGSPWKWSGCSHNMDYGVGFAKKFLDSRETSSDLPSRINLHNNRVGRLAVSANMEIRCKCHGLSGSCELRTCWRSAPDFRRVGVELKKKFRRAVMIDETEFGNRAFLRTRRREGEERQRRKRRGSREAGKLDLWYYERSPTYCDSNPHFDFPGTSGRRCNRTEERRDAGSCGTLCCGRGYATLRQVTTTRCNCVFRWCCEVICHNCTVDEWVTVCK